MGARRTLLASLCGLLLLAGGGALAQGLEDQLDTDKPIEIVADSLEVLQEDQIAVFRGNVDVTQGQIRLRANQLKVYYKSREEGGGDSIASSISRIDALGRVFISSPSETAQGDKGIYYVDRREIALSGKVVLTRGNNVIRGQRLVMNMETGRSKIDGGAATASTGGAGSAGKSGRVRSVFVPGARSRDRQAAPAAKQEPARSAVPVPADKPQRNVTN